MTSGKIWNKFKMKNMGDYHNHYLKKDVLLLADVFEKFISTCIKYYELGPSHHFSSPGLTLVIIQKIQSFLMILIKKLLTK